MNKPRLSLPTGLPPELWLVMALLCIAGLFTGIPVLRALPDAIELVTDGGLWDSIGPLVLVLLLELGLFAAACFVLAWLLSQGDPVARVITVVLSGSLVFALLVGDVLDGTSATVTLLASAAALLCLTVPPRAREFFATRRPHGGVPASVVAAEAIVVMLSALLLAVGAAYLPLTSVEAKFAVVGLALIGISIAGFRLRRRLQTADPAARTLASGLMAGYVVAVLVGGEGAVTGPLFIPLAVAVAVVVLLWIPQESQAFFGGARALGLAGAPGTEPRAPQSAPRSAPRSAPPASQESADESFFAPDDVPPPPPAPRHPPPAPRHPPPAPRPVPPPFPPPPPASAAGPPPPAPRAEPPLPSRPEPLPAPVPTPPVWLLEAPPPGFWPPERRRAEPRQYEMVDLGPPTPDGHHLAPTLGMRFDTTSWFPALEGRDQIRGAYLVSMVMFDDSGVATAFRGTSTLLVTSSRLLGVVPRGESATGPLDTGAGRVAAWSILLDQVDWVQAEGSADGGHLTLKRWDAEAPWALLAKPRVATEGAFKPTRLADLADVVNRAKHSSA